MQWSRYQEAVFREAARTTHDDCAVIARAGAGKTTSLVEALKHVPFNHTLLCAFNKSIQQELERRVPRTVMTRTLHSLGLRVHRLNLQERGRKADVNPEKARKQAIELLTQKPRYWKRSQHDDDRRRFFEFVTIVQKTAAYAKNVLATTPEELYAIAATHDLSNREETQLVADAARELMRRAADTPYEVDFDDMVWFPAHFRYGIDSDTVMMRFDAVFVDEQHDLNAAQHWLVDRMKHQGRCLSVLDPRQTVYSFRGANRKAIETLIKRSAVRLDLPISYRCPHAVIEKARFIVPDIEAAPDAIDGDVQLADYREVLDSAEPGDFILSRTNAPLLATCLALLRLNRPATIAGRDLGQSLIRLIDKSKASTTASLTRWLGTWLQSQRERYGVEFQHRYEEARDRAACVTALLNHCDSIQELRRKIETLFTDKVSEEQIVCSTVHKAKGLERDRVWMLHDSFGYPNPKPWQDAWSEENIWYVAVTRARKVLRFVETPIDEIMNRPASASNTTPIRSHRRQVAWR